jgi:hypothetical protein
MTASRKTIPVADVVDAVNTRLAMPDRPDGPLAGMTPEEAYRVGVASLLEHILHATGNYNGFGYQDSEIAATGILREDYDESRRVYNRPRAR